MKLTSKLFKDIQMPFIQILSALLKKMRLSDWVKIILNRLDHDLIFHGPIKTIFSIYLSLSISLNWIFNLTSLWTSRHSSRVKAFYYTMYMYDLQLYTFDINFSRRALMVQNLCIKISNQIIKSPNTQHFINS